MARQSARGGGGMVTGQIDTCINKSISHTDVIESLIKAFVPTREFCDLIGLEFLLGRQGCIR